MPAALSTSHADDGERGRRASAAVVVSPVRKAGATTSSMTRPSTHADADGHHAVDRAAADGEREDARLVADGPAQQGEPAPQGVVLAGHRDHPTISR